MKKVQLQVKVEEIWGWEMLDQKQAMGPFRITRDSSISDQYIPKNYEWTQLENAKYAAFIESKANIMEGKPHGRLWGIHQEMSTFIKTRNFRQCKLHHQKLINEYRNIYKVISFLFTKYPNFEQELIQQRKNLYYFLQNSDVNLRRIAGHSGHTVDQKTLKQDFLQTDLAYRSEQFQQREEFPKISKKFSKFPSFTQNYQTEEQTSQRQQKLQQCHNYFIEWMAKINNIMNPEQLF